MKVTGFWTPKNDYLIVHHYGEEDAVKKTFDMLYKTAEMNGYNKDDIFYLDYPLKNECQLLPQEFKNHLDKQVQSLLI